MVEELNLYTSYVLHKNSKEKKKQNYNKKI